MNFAGEGTEAVRNEVSTEGNFKGLTWIWKKVLNGDCKLWLMRLEMKGKSDARHRCVGGIRCEKFQHC